MSFDLAVLAMDRDADATDAAVMFGRCCSGLHPDGELDERVVRFYEHLRSEYPDFPPYPADSPWMSMPLSTGIDHVIMHLSFSSRSDDVVELIQRLASQYELVLWDPQSQDVYFPDSHSACQEVVDLADC